MPSITDTQAGGGTEEQVGKGLELFGERVGASGRHWGPPRRERGTPSMCVGFYSL